MLEDRVASPLASDVAVSLRVLTFTSARRGTVNLALSVPGASIDFGKQKGAFHSDVNVLGIAYRANGSVAARFSDTVKLDYQKKNELKDFAKGSFDYQNTFNIAPASVHAAGCAKRGGREIC